MLYEIEKNIWFDNEDIKIFKGSENDKTECIKVTSKKHVPSVHDETWRPTIIYLAATTCNLKCKYCYANEGTYGIKDEKKQFSFQDYLETYTKMWNIHRGIKAISFFGGEPLLNFKEIKKFVEYIYANYSKEQIPTLAINTNGTIINKEIFEFLSQHHFIIGTSIDGTKEIHDENRIGNAIGSTYDLVIKNLDCFYKQGMKIFAQYTFTKQHLDSYCPGKAKLWCQEMEQLPISTYELIPVSSNDNRYKLDLEHRTTLKKYTQFCEEIADYYLFKLVKEDISKVPRMFVGLIIRLLMQVEQHECSAGYSFSITPNKQVYPCHTFTEHRDYSLCIDDISSLDDLKENQRFSEVKEANRELNITCQSCISRKVCGVWCKGLQNSIKGNMIESMDERCILMNIFTKKVIKFIATDYLTNKTLINRKLIKYNNQYK